jgi:hypothetical protein
MKGIIYGNWLPRVTKVKKVGNHCSKQIGLTPCLSSDVTVSQHVLPLIPTERCDWLVSSPDYCSVFPAFRSKDWRILWLFSVSPNKFRYSSSNHPTQFIIRDPLHNLMLMFHGNDSEITLTAPNTTSPISNYRYCISSEPWNNSCQSYMTNIALRDNNSYAMLWNYDIPKYGRTRNLYKARITDITADFFYRTYNYAVCWAAAREQRLTYSRTEAEQEDIPSGKQFGVDSTYLFYKSTFS